MRTDVRLPWRNLALALTVLAVVPTPARTGDTPCSTAVHEDSRFLVCEVDLRRDALRMFWRRPDGEPYGYLASLPRTLHDNSGRLLFATNAGMYDPQLRPVGLYVENGRELVRASTRSGPGNFYMKPNGVFYVARDTAGILATGAFLRQRPTVDFATQSGPMLVINGRLHPRFQHDGQSRKRRTGVGLRDPHTLLFAVSEDEVSFATFARLFRDALKCANALFLDGGGASSIYVPGSRDVGNPLPLGPMVAVFSRGSRVRQAEP
jgi:uncharacterized protein YigE (DUF2233 family)